MGIREKVKALRQGIPAATHAEICSMLDISRHTLRSHLNALGLRNRDVGHPVIDKRRKMDGTVTYRISDTIKEALSTIGEHVRLTPFKTARVLTLIGADTVIAAGKMANHGKLMAGVAKMLERGPVPHRVIFKVGPDSLRKCDVAGLALGLTGKSDASRALCEVGLMVCKHYLESEDIGGLRQRAYAVDPH